MQVKMEYGLARNSPIVGKEIVALQTEFVLKRAYDLLGGSENRGEARMLEVEEIAAMAFGDDQRMAEMDRIDVQNREDMFVLIEDFGRNFPAMDSAENAVVHSVAGKSILFSMESQREFIWVF
jgi:hypothetical protein